MKSNKLSSKISAKNLKQKFLTKGGMANCVVVLTGTSGLKTKSFLVQPASGTSLTRNDEFFFRKKNFRTKN